ncbi:MAG TPA: hypothetical protein VGH27_09590 [Streptosporangiaceae bacterium]|jgi:hypothetical protein
MKSARWVRKLPSGTAVLAAAGDLPAAAEAIGDGADLIDLWAASDETAQQVRDRYPDVPACARTDWAELTRDPAAAQRAGALLVCADPGQAAATGIERGGLLVEALPDQAAGLVAAGWQVVVCADELPGPHAAAAVAAIATWLGAVAVRTSHVTAARRAVDMTETIRGTRPIPAGYVRS